MDEYMALPEATAFAGVPGLEPRLTEPESVVLPITPYPTRRPLFTTFNWATRFIKSSFTPADASNQSIRMLPLLAAVNHGQ